MADLSIHAVQWCAHHGHPVLALRTDDDRYFVVAMSADGGAALATARDASEIEKPSRRLYRLLEATVQLHVGNDNLLRASLRLLGPGGEVSLPANFADGVILAHRGRVPLRMADEDMNRVPLAPLTPIDSPPETPPDAFRSLIESLDLDGLGGVRRAREQPTPESLA